MIKNKKETVALFEELLEKKEFNDVSILDLIKFMANCYGANFKKDAAIEKVDQIIEQKDKMLFILVDGLGAYKVLNLKEKSILKSNLKYAIKTVNPTSTACVLTSIFTAKYPSEHGILGWWQHDKSKNTSYYPLLFKERKTGINLKEKGIVSDDIFKFDSIFDDFNIKPNIYFSRQYSNSDFSLKFAGKKAKVYGTFSIKDAFNKINKKFKEEKSSFNFLYIDEYDTNSHLYGHDSSEAMNVLNEIEEGIKSIYSEGIDATVIITADHGEIEMSSMMYLNKHHDYSKYFYASPSIDTRIISFFVNEEFKAEFEEKFVNEFGDDVILLTKEDADHLNLFGGYNFSENIENTIGEYVAVVVTDKFMVCDKVSYEDKLGTKGNHSGITKEETTVPLIVIENIEGEK